MHRLLLLCALLALGSPAARADDPPPHDPGLCRPMVNASAPLPDTIIGEWLYVRPSVPDWYRGCLRINGNGTGVNRVEYWIDGRRNIVEFDVAVQWLPDAVRFEGLEPARFLLRTHEGSYAPDHFTCATAPEGLLCQHEDTAGVVDPDFLLKRR